MKYCFGVDIGGTTVKLGLFTTEGEIVDKWEIKTRTENQGEAVLPDIAAALNEKLEEKKRTYKLGGFSFEREGTLKWFRDCQRLLQKEFPNVSDEEYAYLKHIRWYIWICDDGTCQHSSFLIREPEETFKHVKDLEIHLANLVEQMDSLRFQPDQIVVWDPRYKNKSMGETIVPFFYLRKKIDDK